MPVGYAPTGRKGWLKPEVGEAEEGGRIRRGMCGPRQLEGWRNCDGDTDLANGDDQRLGIGLIAQIRKLGDHRHVRPAELLAVLWGTGVGRVFTAIGGDCVKRCPGGLVQATGVREAHKQREKPYDERKARDGLALSAEWSEHASRT